MGNIFLTVKWNQTCFINLLLLIFAKTIISFKDVKIFKSLQKFKCQLLQFGRVLLILSLYQKPAFRPKNANGDEKKSVCLCVCVCRVHDFYFLRLLFIDFSIQFSWFCWSSGVKWECHEKDFLHRFTYHVFMFSTKFNAVSWNFLHKYTHAIHTSDSKVEFET